ncbi:MAG TPA: lipoyl synthase [Nitrospiria bacterium]|nr:lipoyl synthase [Nitrospiria bacterium]
MDQSIPSHPLNGSPSAGRRLPEWFKITPKRDDRYQRLKRLVADLNLHTVCEEAHCPNIWECWNAGTATIMILGETCTRSCGFCAVKTGRPSELDLDEPRRVAEAVSTLGLRHAVITSVNRDELHDGGAAIFADTIRRIRAATPGCTVEVLIPDFKGAHAAQDTVFDARPDILNHNTETVPRLYRPVRPQGKYQWTLELIQRAKAAGLTTKSGLMLGLGETAEEVDAVMRDLIAHGCDLLTLGQYLQPSKTHLPVARYYHPDDFDRLKTTGERLGFRHVESGPLVRSSYHAEDQVI